ncbi:MAG: hypothetical protein CVT59_04795 [Actinobacteria bacterium HGW-Actinobacteria-1]|jgi:hypothetical protein|nr:MAG: hypothetical protein CVT59_04795 [Actinobacteria bacterium HGW-Actinobacteria-1]
MARPTKNAPLICGILSAVVVLGVVIGLVAKSPIIVLLAMAPSVAYEVYRTEGETTRWASWTLAGVLVVEFFLIVFKISIDIGAFLGSSTEVVAGYSIPLGDLRIVGPALIAVCALILITRTRGVFTRWLAVNIIVAALALTYVLDPSVFTELLRQGAQEGLKQLD